MPIASGAAGRVDAGVGLHTGTTGTTDGLMRNNKFTSNKCDSYLQRYQELKQKKKNTGNLLPDTQGNTDPSHQESDGAKDGSPHPNGDNEEKTSGKPSSEEGPKKSRLCVLL